MNALEMDIFIGMTRNVFGIKLRNCFETQNDLEKYVLENLSRCGSEFEQQCLVENLQEEIEMFKMDKAAS